MNRDWKETKNDGGWFCWAGRIIFIYKIILIQCKLDFFVLVFLLQYNTNIENYNNNRNSCDHVVDKKATLISIPWHSFLFFNILFIF